MTAKKRFIYLIFLCIVSVICACSSPTSPSAVEPVYVSFVLHYEESFTQTAQYFLIRRNELLDLAHLLHDNNFKLSLQPDWAFMQAAHDFENEDIRQSTNGKNILRYLVENLGHEVDPHAHETSYNYADVAYMIKEFGVDPGNIAGGMIADPPERGDYEHLIEPIYGNHFDFEWQAQWLWGDATLLHTHDTAAAGVWRPKDAEHFYENDDSAPIPCIGKYTNDIEGIYDLISRAETGSTEPNRMLTAAIFIAQGQVSEMTQTIASELEQLKKYETAGKLIFASLSEVSATWIEKYDGKGYLFIQPQ